MVEELKIQNIEKEKEKESVKSLKDKVDETYNFYEKVKDGRIKVKDLKIPRKAKVRKGKIKKGWIGILRVDENGNIDGEKQKVSDSTYKLKEGTYHATDGREVLFYQGKFPLLIQPTWKLNPLNLRKGEKEENETYGQKYVMARMMKDAIKVKGKGGFSGLIWIVVIGVVGYVGYKLLTGGF